jgi:hypothetical protein
MKVRAAGIIVLVVIIIFAGLITGLISFGNPDGTDAMKLDTKIGDPQLISPIDGSDSFNKNITLSWGPVQSVLNYELMIGTGPSFGNPIKEVVVNSSGYTVFLNDGLYYWKVMAIGGRSVSNWTPINSFEIRTALGVSALESPSNNGIVTRTNQSYQWAEVAHASFYRLQVDGNEEFSSPSIDVVVKGTDYSPSY